MLTNNGLVLDEAVISNLADQIAELRSQGIQIILVSSGSIAAGVGELNMSARPERLNELQAAAAVGQASLVRSYDSAFSRHNVTIAQVLITHSDIANRERYLNARNTLQSLLELDVLTIVNENDTVATEEICVGDNDNLAALVANLVDADLLVLLTDQEGLYNADPRENAQAELVSLARADNEDLLAMASGGSALGRGGMVTKLAAARKASHSGASTVIANGRKESVLRKIMAGEDVGTMLCASGRVTSRKQWMAGQMRSEGALVLDAGAVVVLQQQGRSLLAVGVTQVQGEFQRGALVSCLDAQGNELARGLVNYSADEINRLKGLNSERFVEVLGYRGDHEVIHRNNLVLV